MTFLASLYLLLLCSARKVGVFLIDTFKSALDLMNKAALFTSAIQDYEHFLLFHARVDLPEYRLAGL